MNIIFVGYADNGFKCLTAIYKRGFIPKLVIISLADKSSKIKNFCKKNHIPICVFSTFEDLENRLRRLKPHLLVTASFPKIFPGSIINIAKFGSINVHSSLLPKYRGYHPLNWAIIKDEPNIGVTIHYMDKKMDSGDILAQKSIPLENHDTINTAKEKLNDLGAQLLVEVLTKFNQTNRSINGTKQSRSNISFAPKRSVKDGKIKWTENTRDIFNLVRALHKPYPNAFTETRRGDIVSFSKSFISKKVGRIIGKYKTYYLITTSDGIIALKTNKKLKVGDILS